MAVYGDVDPFDRSRNCRLPSDDSVKLMTIRAGKGPEVLAVAIPAIRVMPHAGEDAMNAGSDPPPQHRIRPARAVAGAARA